MSLEKGIMFHKQNRLDLAEEEYMKVLDWDFDHGGALQMLATLYLQKGKTGLAANLYKQALLLKNKKAFEIWNNLGNCYKAINLDADAEACWNTALAIEGRGDEDYSDIHNNLATLYVNAGNPERGVYHCNEALRLNPSHVDGNWNKSLLLLEMGNFGEGFDLYHWGFNTKHRLMREYGREIPYWDGTPGKNIVIWGEQGMGDEILFASMIPDLKKVCNEIVFECHPRMFDLFKASFPDIHIYPTRKDAFINWIHKHPGINARCAMGDLGRFFRRKLEDFPDPNQEYRGYLKANPERIEHYRKKLAKISDCRLKVGISWTGGYLKTRKDLRSVPLIDWEPVLRQDCDFISLQYTPEAYIEICDVEDRLDVKIHHWPSAVQEGIRRDYHETAALVSALDLVITVNTSVHHLTGGLAKPAWVLTPKAKAWRYYSPDGIRFPWYPSARQIEQPENGNWRTVMANVAGELGTLIRTTNDGKRKQCALTM